jgi:hypothetical protein
MSFVPALKKVLARLVVCTLISGCSSGAHADCFGLLGKALAAGGYSGGLDCADADIQIKKIGDIHVKGREFYQAFDLRYKTRPSDGRPPHGGQRILFFDSGMQYIGQYSVGTPPALSFHVNGASLVANVPSAAGNTIELNEKGLPGKVFLNQESVTLYK